MQLSDALIGSGTAIPGTAVQLSSPVPMVWRPDLTGTFRDPGGATCADNSTGNAWTEITYAASEVPSPDLFVLEAEFRVDGSGFSIGARAQLLGGGVWDEGAPAQIGAAIDSYATYTEYEVHKGGTFSSTVFTDSASYAGYVKRRMEVNTVALTYACYANDVLIASGSYTSTAVRNPDFPREMALRLNFDRRMSSGGNVSYIRNVSGSIETLPTASEFWTDLVNAYEVM